MVPLSGIDTLSGVFILMEPAPAAVADATVPLTVDRGGTVTFMVVAPALNCPLRLLSKNSLLFPSRSWIRPFNWPLKTEDRGANFPQFFFQ